MIQTIKVTLKDGRILSYEKPVSLYEIAETVQKEYPYPIMLAKTPTGFKELCQVIKEDIQDLEFVDLSQKDGMRVYQRSATFLMIVAAKRLKPTCNIYINHHITGGYFCEFEDATMSNEAFIAQIEDEMKQMVGEALPISKYTFSTDEALKLFEKEKMFDKKELFKYRRTSTINVYDLDGFKNYFYGYMLTNTRWITLFKLIPYAHGFILQFPKESDPSVLADFIPQPKLSEVFRESEQWAKIMGVDIVASLNRVISQGQAEDLIRISEALHEKKIAQIADKIVAKEKVKLVLIAGPSSSGKTTFAQRLCIQLRVNGVKPHVISIDDYFVNREFTPRDESGAYDFEALEAIDIALFNEHMNRLIQGEEVEIPSFNFVTGQRQYKGHRVQLEAEDILVIEGIHGLNEKLSYAVPKENKFKVYVSCLTQLNIDHHNRIPTTDTRLIRRMIRDNEYRGISPERTIELWASVRRGENKNIFPYQEEADVMFNTVLIYELAVLKQKAEALLFGVDRQSPYYPEAKRMLKFLEYFLGMDTTCIPTTSIIREFIGGSSLHS
ncbi:nucleoside kinase [Sporanaerobium hydrogeniformans]|uniref:Nucleoside kinase n=1 Tax=Sporanaerobium hydrogeniformans TaxID=3072179 RepID=A0AC61DDQ3_9FIRM|nr:nucleoside kinase [Sporanaerobium hydrogeniformans]PHV71067.1 nucleoside kinase [Sporanaerobium hydrogeniformans]